jgi:hypothetical protein
VGRGYCQAVFLRRRSAKFQVGRIRLPRTFSQNRIFLMNTHLPRVALCSLLALAAGLPGAAVAQDRSGRDQVCVYEHAGYGGWEQCFGVGDSIPDLGRRRDEISSIRIRGRAEILLFEHPQFQGREVYVNSNIPDLRRWNRSWNDETDSLQVSRDGFGGRRAQRGRRDADRVCVYEHANYQGRSQCWDNGDQVRDLKRIGWNDSISSIRTFGRTRVALFEHSESQGQRLIVEQDVPDLSQLRTRDGSNWNDRISSLQIRGGRQGNFPR